MKLVRLKEHNRDEFIKCLTEYTRLYYEDFSASENFLHVREIHENNKIIGFVSYAKMPTLFDESVFLDFIFIKPEFRGHGYFKKVVHFISKLFPMSSIFSKVRINNLPSLKAHEDHDCLNNDFMFFNKKSNI